MPPNPTPLSAWSEPPLLLPQKTETDQHSEYLYLFLASVPITSPIFLLLLPLVWARLSARCYQSSPLTIPKWRETYLPRGLSECLPKITLIPNSPLKYLKKKKNPSRWKFIGEYKTTLIPPLMEWQTDGEDEPNFCRRQTRADPGHPFMKQAKRINWQLTPASTPVFSQCLIIVQNYVFKERIYRSKLLFRCWRHYNTKRHIWGASN